MAYNEVMESYIRIVMNSGMLLNEHDELLTQIWKPTHTKKKYSKIYVYSITTALGLSISVYKRSFLLSIAMILPLGFEICKEQHRKYTCRSYTHLFQSLVDRFRDTYNLIKSMLHHYHLRKATINKLSTDARNLMGDIILNRILIHLSKAADYILELILFLCQALKQIQEIIDIGELNFILTLNLEKDNFKNTTTSEDGILHNFDKIYMAYIYVTSTFLCGVGLSLCQYEWKSKNPNLEKLFSKLVPDYLRYTNSTYEKVYNDFNSLYNTLPQKNSKDVHRKVNSSVLNMVNTLKGQIYTCFSLTSALENEITSDADVKETVHTYLSNLENLLSESSQTVEILQYSLGNIHRREVKSNADVENVEAQDSEKDCEVLIRCDATTDVQYEEFNLSIHDSDSSDISSIAEYELPLEHVQSQKLMIKELNQELRNRNIIKQSVPPQENDRKEMEKRCLPQAANPLPISSENHLKSTLATSHTYETPMVYNTGDDFLRRIRAAAIARGVDETVFQDDDFVGEQSTEEDDD